MTSTAGTAQKPKAVGPDTATTPHAPAVPRPRPGSRSPGGPPRPEHPARRIRRAAAEAGRRRTATVPARLRLLRTVNLLVAGALGVLLVVSGTALSGTWSTVTDSDAPRTRSAADLNLALNDMDAQAANILLSSGSGGQDRNAVSYDKAVRVYDEARRTAGHQLRALAVAVDGDRAAEHTVENLTDGFARYQEVIGQAREDDRRPDGKSAAIANYRTATDLLRRELLPHARTLVDTTDSAFLAEHDAAQSRLTAQLATAVALGVLLLAGLGVLQWYLTRSFRRVVNPALAAATVCAIAAVVLGCSLFDRASGQLRVARHDSFDSVVALSRARAIGYDLNADESRYLLDAGRREDYQRSYFEKSQQLYGVRGATLAGYADGLDSTWQAYRARHDDLRFTGEFRREMDNITFAGERAAAERTVETYSVYQRDDRKIRSLVAAGRLREATEFGISWDPGKSNAHFEAWMAALGKDIDINAAVFTQKAREGRDDISVLLPAAGGALLAAAALIVLGLRPRLAEFR